MRRMTLAALCVSLACSSVVFGQSKPATQAASSGASASVPASSAAMEWAGNWEGALNLGAAKLRIVFHVTKGVSGFDSTIDSPDQGAFGLATSATKIEGDSIRIEAAGLKAEYSGRWVGSDDADIDGTWKQNGASFPLKLKRTTKSSELNRPQMPKPPYPYDADEVTFENKTAGATLAGTLTKPKDRKPIAAVVLVSGSGPQDRDESLMGHKPFLVLADHLTRNGIAVLRFDDRGIGKSTGDFGKATTEDFVGDALAGVEYLKKRDDLSGVKIGIIGHSEGALIAPWAATKSSDVAFIVMMAGPGVPGDEILFEQGALIAKAGGASDESIAFQRKVQQRLFAIVRDDISDEEATAKGKAALDEIIKELPEEQRGEAEQMRGAIEQQMNGLNSAWFRLFLRHDPRPVLTQVKCPVLAINGAKDLQVPPKQNLPQVEAALRSGGNTKFDVRELPGLNHLFQTATTGSVSEYAQIEETIAPLALNAMSAWIEKTVRGEAGASGK